MSTLRNKVQLIGNVGQDPTITDLDKGKRVARFTMATNEQQAAGQLLFKAGVKVPTILVNKAQ